MKSSIRFEVFERDRFTCQYCGGKAPNVELEIDHVIPLSAGGSDDVLNLKAACTSCNRGKADIIISTITEQELEGLKKEYNENDYTHLRVRKKTKHKIKFVAACERMTIMKYLEEIIDPIFKEKDKEWKKENESPRKKIRA